MSIDADMEKLAKMLAKELKKPIMSFDNRLKGFQVLTQYYSATRRGKKPDEENALEGMSLFRERMRQAEQKQNGADGADSD